MSIREQVQYNSIYLMPFVAEAALLYHTLKSQGIAVAGFLDNNQKIQGDNYLEIPVVAPTEIRDGSEAAVILCSWGHYKSNKAQLEALGVKQILLIEEVLRSNMVPDAFPQVEAARFKELAPRQALRLDRLEYEIKASLVPESVLRCNDVIMNPLEIDLTERCTLKCRHCSSLVQYFKAPKHISLEQLCRDIDLLMEKVGFVRILRLIGGEPLMHPKLKEIVRHITKYSDKIGFFRLVTNGTILPSEETLEVFKQAGLSLKISDYGELSQNLPRLVEKLEEKEIPYQVEKVIWFEMQQLIGAERVDYQEAYEQCYARTYCNCIMNGKLYPCAFLAYGEVLRAVPVDGENSISLTRTGVTGKDLIAFTQRNAAPPGCRYCSGRSSACAQVPVAEQVIEPLDYYHFGESSKD